MRVKTSGELFYLMWKSPVALKRSSLQHFYQDREGSKWFSFMFLQKRRWNKIPILVINSLQSVSELRSSLGTWTDIQTLVFSGELLSGPEWGSQPSLSPTWRSRRTQERERSWAASGSDPAPWWTRGWWWSQVRLRCTPAVRGPGVRSSLGAPESERWFLPDPRRGSRGKAAFQSPTYLRVRARRAAASAS